MIITPIKKGALEYVVIDDMYSLEELYVLKKEFIDIQPFLKTPKETGTALENNQLLKNAHGIVLDDFYGENRQASAVLSLNRRIYVDTIADEAIKLNAYFGVLRYCTIDYTYLNFYKNGGAYGAHTDDSSLTIVTFFSIGTFIGGDFCFPDYDEVVQFKENRAVIFPGCVRHSAMPIQGNNEAIRISMAQFLNYKV